MSNGRLTSGSSSTGRVQEGTAKLVVCTPDSIRWIGEDSGTVPVSHSVSVSRKREEEWKLDVAVGMWIQKVRGLGQRGQRTDASSMEQTRNPTADCTRTLVSRRRTHKYHAYPALIALSRRRKAAQGRKVPVHPVASGPLGDDRQVHDFL